MNLAVWFGLHVVFAQVGRIEIAGRAMPVPVWHSVDAAAALLTVGAFVCLFGLRLGMMRTLVATTAAGTVLHVALRH